MDLIKKLFLSVWGQFIKIAKKKNTEKFGSIKHCQMCPKTFDKRKANISEWQF